MVRTMPRSAASPSDASGPAFRRRVDEPRRLTTTEYAVLGLLGHIRRPISGYDLKKVADISVGYIWHPSKTQIYSVLRSLVAAECATSSHVVQVGRPNKQLYLITAAGDAAVQDWLARDDETTDPDASMLVLKLFFGGQGDRAALIRQLTSFRDAYAERLTTYESKWSTDDPREFVISDDFTRLTLDYGIARAHAAKTWADAALEELAR